MSIQSKENSVLFKELQARMHQSKFCRDKAMNVLTTVTPSLLLHSGQTRLTVKHVLTNLSRHNSIKASAMICKIAIFLQIYLKYFSNFASRSDFLKNKE